VCVCVYINSCSSSSLKWRDGGCKERGGGGGVEAGNKYTT
jgi:hypothetical protein